MANVHIVGMGGICSAGSCSTISTAAAHAGLAYIQLHALGDDTEIHVARVASLDQDAPPLENAQRLLMSALAECISPLQDDRVGRALSLPLYLAASVALEVPALPRRQPDGHGLSWSSVHLEAGGQAAGLRCLELAMKELQGAPFGLACVAGVDVQCDPDSLVKLHAEGRALSEDRPWGFVPGDGAAAILIASPEACKRFGLESFGGVRACSTADEPAHRQNAPCTGATLSRISRTVLSTLAQAERVDAIYCDLNGERGRTDEWGFTATRLSAFCRDVSRFVAPAQCWGDLGSATSLMLMQLAAAAFSRRDASIRLAFVWAASEKGLRGAALLENTNDEYAAWSMPAGVRPRKEAAHDRAVLAELLSECSFLVEQRFHYQKQLEAEPASEINNPALERIERRLEAQVQGLISGSDLAHQVCSDAIAEPGETYATVRTLFASSTPESLLAYLSRPGDQSCERRRAIASALAHSALHASERHLVLVSAWDAALGLQLAADSGMAPSGSWSALSRLGPKVLGGVFPFAVASLDRKVSMGLLEPWLESDDQALQELAALAFLRVSVDEARSYLWDRRDRPAFTRPLIVGAQQEQLAAIEDTVLRHQDPQTRCRAWGLLGTSRAVEDLLQLLETVPSAAGEALHLISGAELFGESLVEVVTDDASLTHVELVARRKGDSEVGVERSRKRRFAADPEGWKRACDQLFQKHGAAERCRLGAPISARSILRAVTHPNLAPSTRSVCIDELAIGYGIRLPSRSDPRMHERTQDVASVLTHLLLTNT